MTNKLFLAALLISITFYYHKSTKMDKNPPIAKEIEHQFTINNNIITDEYFWMRDKNWPKKVDDKDVISYLEEENAYAKNFLDKYSDLKEQIFDELKARIKLTDQSSYIQKDDYFYYTRTEENSDYQIFCRKYKSVDAKEEIILDVNHLANGKDFTSIGSFSISPDHKLLAYSVDFSGDEKYTIRILNLENGKYLEEEIINTSNDIVWLKDVSGFFYVPKDEDLRNTKVMLHKLSDNNDRLIFEESNVLYNVSIEKSSSLEYLLIRVSGHENNEYRFLSLSSVDLNPKLIMPKRDSINYSVDHNDKYFYISTNDKGGNFRMIRMSIEGVFEDYIDMDKEKYLSSFDITKQYLILNYKDKGLSHIEIINLITNEKQIISFPEEAYTAKAFSTNFILDDIRVDYSSLGRPSTLYKYNFETKALSILKTQEIPSGFDPEEYQVKRLWADNQGTLVPISLIYKKDLFKNDGSNPLYLYGYGSYGISVAPSFRSSALSLVNRGFVFAIAHIRGGDDLGYNWYESAKFLTKKNTFEDFVACSDYLIKENYTSRGNIVISGGSAGGMLVGAAANMKPDLYKAVIAHVPFVDVLNTMLDETLPLTPGEFKEWGDPKDLEYFKYIKSYSPYDNIEKKNYPAFFVTAGISDPRVGYWEPAKWVAKLRKMKTDNNVILFKTNMDSGHQGASGRFDYLKEIADEYLFIITLF